MEAAGGHISSTPWRRRRIWGWLQGVSACRLTDRMQMHTDAKGRIRIIHDIVLHCPRPYIPGDRR